LGGGKVVGVGRFQRVHGRDESVGVGERPP
jgi:hypothetical protein